jgi:hypothetical protein
MAEQDPTNQGRWDARQGRFVPDGPVSPGAIQRANIAGDALIYPNPDKPKNLALAALLGLIVPGLGHFYIGQYGKGALIMFGGFFACLWVGGLLGPFSSADAYTLAQHMEEGHPIGRWQWFWELK